MAYNKKNIDKPHKPSIDTEEGEKIARYTKATYFQKKDKQAAEFLKKHPLPAKFLK